MMQTEQISRRNGHLHEECGVFGVYSPATADLAGLVYYGLFSLQHRGQESAGIIGVDSLGYLSVEDVVRLAGDAPGGFCTACFGGGYPTAIPSAGEKDRFENKIHAGKK